MVTLRTKATAVFGALADDTRRRILTLLKDGPKNVGEIAEHFDIAQPSITHHLTVLRNAGLVSDERRGKNVYYALEKSCLLESLTELMAATGVGADGRKKRSGKARTRKVKT